MNAPDHDAHDDNAEQIVHGIHPVLEALEDDAVARRAVELNVQAGHSARVIGKAIGRAKRLGIKVREVPSARLSSLCDGGNHQGLALRMGPFPYADVDDILDLVRDKPDARLLLLDQVQDPRNLGALLRSAVAFGFHGVVLTRDRSAPVNAAAIRTSVGASFKIPICRIVNLARLIARLKEEEIWVYGAANAPKAQTLARIDWRRRVALVLGAEGTGLRRLTCDRCDALVRIPHSDQIDSLNVSVAGSLLMYTVQQAWTD